MIQRLIFPFIALTSVACASNAARADKVVSVRFYGESQCPYCRKFVEETWNEMWSDQELRSYLDYDFVPWGNSYFATSMCGSGPYDPQERACFYDHCITSAADDESACFGGDVVYQHSAKEGQIDIYETCILKDVGLAAAVDFTYCAEGSEMDQADMSARELMIECIPDKVDPKAIQECMDTRGHSLEINNAKATPVHPGVPYVLVDGEPVQDPFATKQIICQNLEKKGITPAGCTGASQQIIASPTPAMCY